MIVAGASAWADEQAKDDYTRQAAMSTAGWMLRNAGLEDEAEKLYREQLDKAVSPHYFMSYLGSMAREAGDSEQAVEWLEKAWSSARGRACSAGWPSMLLLPRGAAGPRHSAIPRWAPGQAWRR